MSLILALTAAGMVVHLVRLKRPVNAKKWLLGFYFSLFCWQVENMVRYSLPPEYEGLLLPKLSATFILIPGLAFTLICHTQYVYCFLADPFPRERKKVFLISLVFFLAEFAFAVWNEFFGTGNFAYTRMSAFVFSAFFTLWMIALALRKARYLHGTDPKASKAHYIYAGINGCYVIGSTISIVFGFLTVPGSWSYFSFVWLGNLASIVLYIVTAAVPAGFQTKITGFSFIVAATILCIITMTFYPPDYSADLAAQMAQQQGLTRLVIIVPSVALLIVTLMPLMLRASLTRPLERLLEGVEKVNAGQLDTHVEVGLRDEIGLLTENFNHMTQSMKKAQDELTNYAQTLEIQVATRTKQLQQSLNDLKATQAQLIQREKMASLGELTAGIAHEIKNPLNFIVNFSEVSEDLADELREEINKVEIDKENVNSLLDDITGNFQKMVQHGKKASSIVSSMLKHSRASKGIKEQTDLNELIETYLHASYEEMQIKNKSFRSVIEKNLDPEIGKLNVVPEDIGRVLLNLFNNAFYSVSEKKKLLNGTFEPTVTITTKKESDRVALCIRDNGTGIPQQIIDKIFQPFFTTKPAGEGTGLGLSLSYDIITNGHKGEIIVETKEGEGTAFIVQLPFQEQKPTNSQ
ncbi:sensor histidine kinase [Flavisolibacter nicotianae]|uniref:sensor histidine kinase n=1 Tax=Flavisolibacter nicotianae TaxID=2364882 RepID=UPI0013C4B93F|nr:ATP-binding protein [Flavisolibacter nicotianae]